jgi:DNA-binding NtrC family response regulator
LSAADAAEALKLIKTNTISVLAISLAQPKISGLELLVYVARKWPAISLIVMLEKEVFPFPGKAVSTDKLIYAFKPFEAEALASSVITGIEQRDEGLFKNGLALANIIQLVWSLKKPVCWRFSRDSTVW